MEAELRQIEPELSDGDFARIARHVHDATGILLPQNKRPLLRSRLMRRLRILNFGDFRSYAALLESADGENERAELISAVTTNVTAFFREQHHFDVLAQRILPPLVARAKAGGRVRLWSAGCSTGEEPYSIAAVVLQQWPEAPAHDLRILATDIDQEVVSRTRGGLYPEEAARTVPSEMVRRLFDDDSQGGKRRISAAARSMVTCNILNLQGDWPMRGGFDVIFCRNVVIYFDRPTQERLWQRFAAQLAPSGYLMIGHSERVAGPALDSFQTEGITTYRHR